MADFLKIGGVGRAMDLIPAHELSCWVEYIRRKANEPTVQNLYLHDLSYSLFQLRRAWASGMPSPEYKEFERKVRFGPSDAPPPPAATSADAHKQILLSWVGLKVGNEDIG